MWTRVLPTNQQLVSAAYDVLSAHGTIWHSAAAFKHWLQTHNDQVFYLAAPEFSLVVGFRAEGNRWRATVGGIDGQLSLDALKHLLDKAVSFVREQGGNTLLVRLRDLPPSNKFAVLYQMATAVIQGDPDVATVSEADVGRHRLFTVTLRDRAA